MTRPRGSSKGGRKRKPETVLLELLRMATCCRCERIGGEHAGYCPGDAYDRLIAELRAALKDRSK